MLIETDPTSDGRGADGVTIPGIGQSQSSITRELTEEERDGPAVTISIIFYVTAEYRQQISPISPLAYVDMIIAKLNEGYIKSEMNMRAEAFCIKPASIQEVADPGDLLDSFRASEIFVFIFILLHI